MHICIHRFGILIVVITMDCQILPTMVFYAWDLSNMGSGLWFMSLYIIFPEVVLFLFECSNMHIHIHRFGVVIVVIMIDFQILPTMVLSALDLRSMDGFVFVVYVSLYNFPWGGFIFIRMLKYAKSMRLNQILRNMYYK